MARLIAGSTILVPALLLVAAAPFSMSSPDRKCGPQPARQDPVVLVDGVIVKTKPASVLQDLGPGEVHSIEILCMDPRDSTLNHSHGIPAVSILTKAGLISTAKRTLAAIVDAQDAHFRRESEYLAGLERISLPPRPAQVHVAMEAGRTGWVARATIDGLPETCVVYDGDIAAPAAGLLPGHARCFTTGEAGRYFLQPS
jgi:hypothetical protein